MKKKVLLLAAILAASILLYGCTMKKVDVGARNIGKIEIFTSFYPMYFFASEIAGNKADIINLTPAGAEPHDWEPKPRTIGTLQNADMFVYNGVRMETWADSVIATLDTKRVKVVCASNGIELLKGEKGGGEAQSGDYDPHVWLSPIRAKQQAQNVLKALIEIDSVNKDYYTNNYNKLAQKLDKLDRDYKDTLGSMKKNVIVVAHEAFGYLTHDYKLRQVSIRGIIPEEEPSSKKLGELVNICRENNVKYVFFETFVSPRLSNTLAAEIGGQTLVLNTAEGLTDEELKNGKNYITVMYENLENLKKALSE